MHIEYPESDLSRPEPGRPARTDLPGDLRRRAKSDPGLALAARLRRKPMLTIYLRSHQNIVLF
jgi:hypothetical protein